MKNWILLSIVLAGTPVLAQQFEIAPYAAYRTGGAFGTSIEFTDRTLTESGAWGISFGYWTKPDSVVEFRYSLQNGKVNLEDHFGLVATVDVDIEYYQLGGRYYFLQPGSKSRIIGFISGSIGATRFSGPDSDTSTNFSGSLGGGADIALGAHVAVRLDGRFLTTLHASSGTVACAANSCLTSASGSYFSQFETTAGLAFKF